MPRGIRKRGAFDFTVWYADGSRFRMKSTKPLTDEEIKASLTQFAGWVTENKELDQPKAAHD